MLHINCLMRSLLKQWAGLSALLVAVVSTPTFAAGAHRPRVDRSVEESERSHLTHSGAHVSMLPFIYHNVMEARETMGEDPWPYGVEGCRRTLEALGYVVDWHVYPMPHSVCMEEIADISSWLAGRAA